MIETSLKRKISKMLRELSGEIEEGLNYGIPHLVGEIKAGNGEPEVEMVVSLFDSKTHFMRLILEKELLFIFPAEDPHPYRLFLDFWRFLEGKGSEKSKLEKGDRVRGPINEVLRRCGYSVLWMNVQMTGEGEVTQVWTKRGGIRYNMTFKKVGKNEFVLIDITKV